jgi:hypothetical protein
MHFDDSRMKLIDAIAWAKTCLLIAAQSRNNASQLAVELGKLEEANKSVRSMLPGEKDFERLPFALKKEIRVCEIGLERLRNPEATAQ